MERILIINNFFSRSGGAHVAALNQFNLLNESNVKVKFFCASSDLKNDKNVVIAYKTKLTYYISKFIFFGYLFDFYIYYRLNKLINEYKPNVIHVHLFKAAISNSVLSVLKNKVDMLKVITHHDYSLIDSHSLLVSKDGKIMREVLAGNVFSNVLKKTTKNSFFLSFLNFLDWKLSHNLGFKTIFDLNITVSNFSRETLLKSPYGLNSKVLYNFTPDLDIRVKKKKEFDICFVGRLSEEKGIKFYSAIDKMKSIKINFNYLFIGHGPLKKMVSKFNKKSRNINLISLNSERDVKEYISKSKWLILPSTTYENNPLVIIESWSVGVPVIGSKHGGIKELLEMSKTLNLSFEPNNSKSILESLKKLNNISFEITKTFLNLHIITM